MQIAILDDESLAAEELAHKLKDLPCLAGIEYQIDSYASSEELLAATDVQGYPDILLCDVCLGEQDSGIDLISQHFASGRTQIIYVSGYLENAVEVYRTDHTYFLLKPVDRAKLSHALEKALAGANKAEQAAPVFVELPEGRNRHMVNAQTIVFAESNLRKIHVHKTDGQTISVYMKLDELESLLPEGFVRIHQGFLVNMAFIERVRPKEVELSDGTALPVSRNRSKEVQAAMVKKARKRA